MRQLLLDVHQEMIIDNFAGGGGASTGIELALGRRVDIAINHDPEAVAMHTANHPETRHYCESVWEINPREVTQSRPVGLVWLSPDCFPAGTLVLTRDGYMPIEEIQIGDEVMTHKARWRRVTETSSARRPLISVRGHGHPGLAVSPEHPFMARLRKDVWQTEPRGYKRTLEPQDWVPASALDKGWYWATLTDYPSASVPEIDGRGMVTDDKLLWLAGRYLGDGWTRLTETRAEVVITCGKHEVERLRDLLDQWPRAGSKSEFNELSWHERSTSTAYQFTTNHRGLVQWLRKHFGHRAECKKMPAWALGMAPELRRALLAGYLSADGWENEIFSECRTVSKALAFGIKALLNTVGKTVIVHRLANSTVIEGRDVNAREIYMLRWRANVDDKHAQTFREGGIEWCPIREQDDLCVDAEVFNIGVADDESYLVEGIIVHNCKHFSKAKGGKPVEKKIRGLAWVALRWAATVQPRVIMLENVEEFVTWGPLVTGDNGEMRPCPKRKGREFNAFVNALRRQGYAVEWRELRACDFGAPTIRKRLFLIARRDGRPICWPSPTHGDPKSDAVKQKKLKPWRTAAECIDWSLPCPSIFERAKPLADATLRRIAKGIVRYVVNADKPFIVGSAAPVLTEHANASSPRSWSADEPLRTICAQTKGGHHALIAPTLVQTGYGEREGQSPRALDIEKPLGTLVGSQKHALVSAFLAKHYTGVVGADLADALPTVTSVDHNSLVTANLVHMGHGEQSAGGKRWSHGVRDIEIPLNTVTANGIPAGVVTSHLQRDFGKSIGSGTGEPIQTITAGGGGHVAEVRAFLVKYYGTDQDPNLREPLHTITTKDRYGLVTVAGEEYRIADIGLRMLSPRELFRAQGFPESYIIGNNPAQGLSLTKSAQVRMCGNSVCPPLSAALVRANVPELAIKGRVAA